MPSGFWISLIAFVVVLYPFIFILSRYESNSLNQEHFRFFEFFDTIWLILNVVVLGLNINRGYPAFTLIAIVTVSITIPTTIFSGFTGVYPERTRGGYKYYSQYKSPTPPLLMEQEYPELKITGWVQTLFLVGVILISLLNL